MNRSRGIPSHIFYRHVLNQTSVHALPFVGHDRNFWDIPALGRYAGGRITGAAMAYAYMRELATADDPQDSALLQDVVFSMAKKMADPRFLNKNECLDEDVQSLHGQVCGFFSTLEDFLHKFARKHQKRFTKKVTEEAIENMADRGINLDAAESEAYWQAKIKQANQESIFEPKPY